jgi:CubicO group peptidase (beta-lactamase class C family)
VTAALDTVHAGPLADILESHVRRGHVAGAVGLVALGDSVLVTSAGVQDLQTHTEMRRDTMFRIASMTKPVTAAAAMLLVDEGKIALDGPVDRWLPELAERRVLRTPEAPLDDTVPAERPITLEDLLTLRAGIGWIQSGPLAEEMARLGVAPGPDVIQFGADEFMARIGRLPLASQPGTRWHYHTAADILTVLITRIAGAPLDAFLHDRIFAPLGMRDTGFYVPAEKLGRLATCYQLDEHGRLTIYDRGAGGQYSAAPPFPTELVSTADDYLTFARMLIQDGAPLLSPASAQRMRQDHLTPAQKAASPFFPGFWDNTGWGYGGAITTNRVSAGPHAGSYGWAGGFGTSFTIDPAADFITMTLTQRVMRTADDTAIADEFRAAAYQTWNTQRRLA